MILTCAVIIICTVIICAAFHCRKRANWDGLKHQNRILLKQMDNLAYRHSKLEQKLTDLKAHNFKQSEQLTTLKMQKAVMFGIDEYQDRAILSAIYPDNYAVVYPALALAGEAGEVANKVKKYVRGDFILDDDRRDAIGKEIGGVLWYCAALARDLNLNLSDIARQNLRVLEDRKQRGVIQGDGDER